MAFQVLVTEIANDDLAAPVRFIARDNPSAAEHFGLALIEKSKLLPEQPLLGRVLAERGHPTLRETFHRPYHSVYRPNETKQTVEARRFWHGARAGLELGR